MLAAHTVAFLISISYCHSLIHETDGAQFNVLIQRYKDISHGFGFQENFINMKWKPIKTKVKLKRKYRCRAS